MQGKFKGRLGRAAAAATVAASLLVAAMPVAVVTATSCLATGALDRDETPLTARLINPAGTVSGTVDATGCDVGVYFSEGLHGRVNAADVFGARYYGVLVDGNEGNVVHVDVKNSKLHDIGDAPLTSGRHGQGVAYRSFGSGSATGTVSGNRVWNFQEAGINLTGPGSTVTVSGNSVRGRGPIATLSQNGVQVIFGAHGKVLSNRISDLSYTGDFFAANGVLVVGGPIYNGDPHKGCLPTGCDYTTDTRVAGNVITAADTGIVFFNMDENFSPSPDPTSNVAFGNVIRDNELTNLNGWDIGLGVQEGVYAFGNRDRIVDNVILGRGYDQDFCGDAAICMAIDTEGATDPIVTGNIVR